MWPLRTLLKNIVSNLLCLSKFTLIIVPGRQLLCLLSQQATLCGYRGSPGRPPVPRDHHQQCSAALAHPANRLLASGPPLGLSPVWREAGWCCKAVQHLSSRRLLASLGSKTPPQQDLPLPHHPATRRVHLPLQVLAHGPLHHHTPLPSRSQPQWNADQRLRQVIG